MRKSPNTKRKLFVFDWNGTILADTVASWKAGNACFEFYNAPPITLEHYRNTFAFPILDFYEANGCSAETVLAQKEESNVLFQESYEALVTQARTRTGARPLLSWLNNNGVHCMILSNYITHKIAAQVKRLGLEEYFEYICAHNCDGTTILQGTTKTGRLKAYMEREGFLPQNTMIIGDSLEEPEIAKELGLTSISIKQGYVSTKRLKATNPDYMVGSLKAVRNIAQEVWNL